MEKASSALYLIPLLPLIGAAVNLVFARTIGRRLTHVIAVGSVAASFGVVCYLVGAELFPLWKEFRASGLGESGTLGGLTQDLYTWIAVGDPSDPNTRALELELAFRMDTLSALMTIIITGVGLLIHIYSTGYMAEDPRYAAYFGYLNLFTGAMLILVLGDNLPVMFIGWEGVGLCSYLLIGFWFTNEAFAYAGRKAFIVNRIGDFAFLLGICLLFWATGSLDFQDYQSAEAIKAFEQSFLGPERLAMFGGVLLFIGAAGKSAQIPLYVWLPDAMAGPTPVSALIHAATMVTAGVYMVARLSFLYASSTTAMAIVAGVGTATALFAALMAFAQRDLKKVLAYSTVSQLGFMFAAVGVGAHVAGVFHLMTHAFFKAGLFLGAGSVMHAMSGSGDIMKMGGLRRRLPYTHATFLIFTAAIAGVPFFSGFFSKDEILAGVFAAEGEGWWLWYGELLWGVLVVAALCTAFYMTRLYCLVFLGDLRADEETRAHIHESPSSMTLPLVALAVFAATAGFFGLPHVSIPGLGHLPNFVSEWLGTSLKPGVGPEVAGAAEIWGLMGIATLSAIVGIGIALSFYRRGPSIAIRRFTAAGIGDRVYEIVYNKFYVDELYEKIVIRPFRWLAVTLYEVVDRFLIDLIFVNGSAFVVDVGGRVVRWFQNGQVQRYLVGLVIGGALVFFLASRPDADIEYEVREGTSVVKLEAELGGGAVEEDAEVAWDFDGDGETDSTEPAPSHDFGRPGRYRVHLRVTGGVFETEHEVTRKILIPEEGGEE